MRALFHIVSSTMFAVIGCYNRTPVLMALANWQVYSRVPDELSGDMQPTDATFNAASSTLYARSFLITSDSIANYATN